MDGSAQIGASASSYTGDAALGGGSFGFAKLDVSPILELAKYRMLYNKAEYDQRQKDAEKVAEEIGQLTSYDLTSSIPKDAKILQEKWDKITEYVKNNPGATDYKNKKEWMEYRKMRNDLDNDLRMAKTRNIMNMVRKEEISKEPDAEMKALMERELQSEIDATDIRTPIQHSHKYGDFSVKLPDAPELTFDVVKTGPNATVIRDFKMFNVPRAKANSDVFTIGLENEVGLTAPEKERSQIARKNNFWIQGAEVFNNSIQAATVTTQTATGPVTVLDESKLNSVSKRLVSLAKETNKYLTQTKNEIKAGVYKDKFERTISFGDGALQESDYAEINYQDGLSPEELALIAQYAKWNGDTHDTKVQQTDNAIQMSGQAITRQNNKDQVALGYARIAEDKRQFDESHSGTTSENKTSGNAFDEIGGTKEIVMSNGGKISNGFVIDRNGNKMKAGSITTPVSNLPASMISALKAGGFNIDYDGKVNITYRDGEITSVEDAEGKPISRTAMENAQKKYDTERKGQDPLNWGRKNPPPLPANSNGETPEQRAERILNGGK